MTAIIGFVDKEKGVTFMGGDSMASNSYSGSIIAFKKVFKLNDSKNAILGFSGAVRDINLLHYAENLIDKRDEPNIDEKYIVTKFIPNIIKLFSNNGRNASDKGINEFESYFLFAYKDRMWKIGFDYSVLETACNFQAIGSGTDYALGSMFTNKDSKLTPIEKIHIALQSASNFAVGVAPPFYIINTANDEVIEFKE